MLKKNLSKFWKSNYVLCYTSAYVIYEWYLKHVIPCIAIIFTTFFTKKFPVNFSHFFQNAFLPLNAIIHLKFERKKGSKHKTRELIWPTFFIVYDPLEFLKGTWSFRTSLKIKCNPKGCGGQG